MSEFECYFCGKKYDYASSLVEVCNDCEVVDIAHLRAENETLRAANSQLTDALKIETEEGRIDRREKEKLRAKVEAGKLFAREMAVVCNMAISGIAIGAIVDSLERAITVFEKADGE